MELDEDGYRELYKQVQQIDRAVFDKHCRHAQITRARALATDMTSLEHAVIEMRTEYEKLKQDLVERAHILKYRYERDTEELRKHFRWVCIANALVALFLTLACSMKVF